MKNEIKLVLPVCTMLAAIVLAFSGCEQPSDNGNGGGTVSAEASAVASFRAEYAKVLAMDPEAEAELLDFDEEETVYEALVTYEGLSGAVKALLRDEYLRLDDLLERLISAPASARAAFFKNKHAEVLALTIDTVTNAHENIIMYAQVDFNRLQATVKPLLSAEKTLLDSLDDKLTMQDATVATFFPAVANAISTGGAGTADAPVALNVANIAPGVNLGDSKYRSKLSKAIADDNKYVALDLSGVPMNAVFDRGALSDAAIVKIVSLTLSESVTKIADHLHGDYPDLKVEERGVFYGYTALKTISLPAVTYIGNHAFDKMAEFVTSKGHFNP
jgi:hypothetical protein